MTNFSITRTTRYHLSFLILLITISLAFISMKAEAGKNYYFSTSTGDDSRTSTQAQNPATPWKTISKLNSTFSSFLPGDSILFMRGDSFQGTITINASGSVNNPIVIDAFGTGANPLITGLNTVSSWTNEGGGIYSKAITFQSIPNIVTLDGVSKPLGRFPKSGYNVMDAVTSTSLTDADLNSGTTNYTGAIAVIRKHYYVIDRCPITNHSSHTLTISNPSSYNPLANWGYFIENHLSCLTQLGDWAFTGGKLYMYFGANNPTSYTVQVSVLDKLLTASSKNYITINNLAFQGANVTTLDITTCDNWVIDRCEFKYGGKDGIKVGGGSDNTMISNNLFEDIHNTGIFVATYRGSTANTTVRSNTFNRSAIYPGMGGDGSETGIACYLGCDNSLVENNRISQAGFNGFYIDATYTNVVVRKNYITETNSIKNDGGGIYLFESAYTSAGGIKIYGNIVLNTQDAHIGTNGTNKLSHGIYLDGRAQLIEMYGNTCANNEGAGFLIGAWTRNIDMSKGNTLYNNQYQMRILRWTPETAYPNIDISNTLMFSKTAAQYSYLFECTSAFPSNPTGVKDFIAHLGTVDNNYMGKITGDANISIVAELPSYLYKTLSTWKTYSNIDANSTQWSGAANDLLFEYNETNVNKVVAINGTYTDVYGTVYSSSITIPPYSSVLLIKSQSTGANSPPSIQNQVFQLNENSPNGTSVGTVVASDPNAGQTLAYSILSGNTNSAFSINASSGVIKVANSSALNFESIKSFAIIVKVQDNGTGNLSSQATITFSVLDINEAPVIAVQSFSVPEAATIGTNVGAVTANDPDAGQTKSFSILSGNTNGAYAINTSTGVLSVANSAALDFEVNPSFDLVVKVQDNGTGNLVSQATETVLLVDVNEAPAITNQSFTIAENSVNTTAIGTVVATDHDAGQTKTFSILSGNTGSAFAINASSGVLTVTNSAALNFEVTPTFALVIKVQDNGTGNLSSQATITVSLNDVNEAPSINSQTFSVPENSANGITFGTIVATDPDAGQTKTYSILSGNTGSAFAINASTGVISIANISALNFEVTPSFTLIIKAQDNGTGNLSSQATITVSLTDVNEAPVISNQAFSVAENAAGGTTVGTIAASDPDAGQTTTFSILSGNTNGAFTINTKTGVVSVASSTSLNFEATSSFALIIEVQDNGTGNLSSQATITISLSDDNEAPVISNQSFSLVENAANGTIIGTVAASDSDAGQTKTFSILSGNTNSVFAINTSTGVITVANSTELIYALNPSFSLNIGVTDNGAVSLSDNATITITISQAPNQAPAINNQSFSIAENSLSGTIVGTVFAADPDASQSLTFSLLSGNTNGAFAINASTGVISIANTSALNFEFTPSFALVIKVQDNGTSNLASQATVNVSLTDDNEAPVISNQSFSLVENAANGTIVGTVAASEPDAGQTKTFSIISGNTNDAFAINPSTGVLTVATSAALNFETTPTYTLILKVQDNGSGNLSSQATLSVSLTDVNEAPVISNQSFSVAENAADGTTVGTIAASDPDAGQATTFAILSGNTNGAFTINATTGVVSVVSSTSLNFEVTPTFALIIKVQDNGTGNHSSQATITVSLNDVNEAPTINSQTFSITENSVNGTTVGSVVAADSDAGQTNTFSILSGNTNGAFTINATTGVVSVASSTSLNFEVTPTFALIIKIQDNGTGNLSSQATITISLTDVNEAPVISNQSFSLVENAANGTIVGTVAASDPEVAQNKSFSIISGNTNDAFAINASTGVITVANSTALNYTLNSSFSLNIVVTDNGVGSLSDNAAITITISQSANQAPAINNQSFSIAENSMSGTIVGTVIAADPDASQSLAFSILSGNSDGSFAINASTGVLTVANASVLNFEATPSFSLVVKVQDNGTGYLSNQATITVAMTNVNEAPVMENMTFNVLENSDTGTIIGYLSSTDPDKGQSIEYSIISGNEDNTFRLNTATGLLTVFNSDKLNFSLNPEFTLTILAKDNGTYSLSALSIVKINLLSASTGPVVYIDPTNKNDLAENGSITHPYDSWEDFTFQNGSTYLQKRATTFIVTKTIKIEDKENITIDAYGSGNIPIISSILQGVNVIEFAKTRNCKIRNLEITADPKTSACIDVSGESSTSLTIENCNLHDALYGIRSISQIEDFVIANTAIYKTGLDGIRANNFKNIEIRKCNVSSVNQSWLRNPNALGSCIDLNSESGKVYIHENELDHSETGNMSVIKISGNSIEGLIERNTMKGKKISGNHCLNLINNKGKFVVRYNSISGGEIGINANADSSSIYYNQLIENSVAIKIQQYRTANILNNTFYGNENYSIESLKGSKIISMNNIFYLSTTAPKAYNFNGSYKSDHNTFNIEKSGFLNGYSTLSKWISASKQDSHSSVSDPMFEDIGTYNFRIKSNSPCINKGSDLVLKKDYFGTLVPQAGVPDIGFCEVLSEYIQPIVEEQPAAPSSIGGKIDISVYPNPSNGIVNIKMQNIGNQPVDIKIFNMNGYKLINSSFTQGQELVVFNLENQKSGIYLAKITFDGHQFTKQIILKK